MNLSDELAYLQVEPDEDRPPYDAEAELAEWEWYEAFGPRSRRRVLSWDLTRRMPTLGQLLERAADFVALRSGRRADDVERRLWTEFAPMGGRAARPIALAAALVAGGPDALPHGGDLVAAFAAYGIASPVRSDLRASTPFPATLLTPED